MANYNPNEVVDILLTLGECRRNYVQASRLYSQRFPNRRHPSDRQILNIERRSRRNVLIRQRQRNRIINNNDARLITVLGMVHQNPHISLRQIEQQLGIPRSTAHRLLHSVKFRPYHIHLLQELSANDHQLRIQFCTWALDQLNNNPDFFLSVIFSDEATFHSTGCLNRHNCHYWSPDNPRWTRRVLNQHRWSLNTWLGVYNGQIIGPYFFNQSVNGRTYLHFLQMNLPEYMENIPLYQRGHIWYQHDGAPAHYDRRVRNYLDVTYPNRWIGRGGPILWPPRSPDLNPLDFFMWGFLKNCVFEEEPTTRENMVDRIMQACRRITPNTLQAVIRNFSHRLYLCLENNGGNFEHLL